MTFHGPRKPSPTQYTDAETGFVYLRNRYYDPATGQFVSRDPLAAITQSPYGYVGGNPLSATDPLGLFKFGNFAKWTRAVLDVGAATFAVAALATDFAGVPEVGLILGGVSAGLSGLSALDTCVAIRESDKECAIALATFLLSVDTVGVAKASDLLALKFAARGVQLGADALGLGASAFTTTFDNPGAQAYCPVTTATG